jgi:hypothetical protein
VVSDPTIYKAQFDQQMARRALDAAVLANSKGDLERYANLLKKVLLRRREALILDRKQPTHGQNGAFDRKSASGQWSQRRRCPAAL